MLFNSYIFVFALLPVSLVLYYFFNRIKKYTVSKISLIIFSFVFYAYFNWYYFLIILSSIVINYLLSGLLLKDKINDISRKIIVIGGVLLNLLVLGYFKYFNFLLENINMIFNSDFQLLNIVLPLGISFFTFQQLSYLIDSYKREVPKYNFFDYALFVSFFPQLVAGPIVLHSEIVPQFADESNKKFNFENFSKGITAFAFGQFK